MLLNNRKTVHMDCFFYISWYLAISSTNSSQKASYFSVGYLTVILISSPISTFFWSGEKVNANVSSLLYIGFIVTWKSSPKIFYLNNVIIITSPFYYNNKRKTCQYWHVFILYQKKRLSFLILHLQKYNHLNHLCLSIYM